LGLAFVASTFRHCVFSDRQDSGIIANVENKIKPSGFSKKSMRLSDLLLLIKPAVMLQSRLAQ
jgi:hypothetical protein